MSSVKMNLMSSDGKIFCVEEAAVLLSMTMKNAIFERYYGESAVANKENQQEMVMVVGMRGDLLAKVMEYCEKHSMKNNHDGGEEEDMEKWDSEFVGDLDGKTLEDLIRASARLRIHSLHVLLGKRAATLRAPRKIAKRSVLSAAMIPPLKKERNAPPTAPLAHQTRVAKRRSELSDSVLPPKKRREACACSVHGCEEKSYFFREEDGMEESVGENYLDNDHQLLNLEVEREDDDAQSTCDDS